jgi:hypothetical protein
MIQRLPFALSALQLVFNLSISQVQASTAKDVSNIYDALF